MQKYIFNILKRNSYIVIFILSLTGCSEFFVKDISNDIPTIIIPSNGDTLLNNLIHFKWEEMGDVDGYRLQVVSPSFVNITSYPLDTFIIGTEFFFTLDPGVYEYRLRGENSAFQSQFSTVQSFVVDSTSDLSSLSLNIISPSDLFYTNETSPTFVWSDLYPADVYTVEIRLGTSWFTATQIESGNSLSSFYTLTSTLVEGNYLWQITASNALPSSTSSAIRTLYVDLTAPGTPNLVSPTDLDSFVDTVNFSWTSGSNTGGVINSPIYDSVYLFSDSLNPINSEIARAHSVNSTYQYIFLTSSSPYFYWRVKTLDEAGNSGSYSTIRRVVIQ